MPYPAAVLDLRAWKLTLPIAERSNAGPWEVSAAELASFDLAPYFQAVAGGVRFRAPVTGVTTPGSRNVRSELREMTARDPSKPASWSSTDGVGHTLWVDVTPTRIPTGPDGVGVVVAQIHDADDDVAVWRVEKSGLWLAIGDHRDDWLLVDPKYRVGTRLRLGLVVDTGQVGAWRDGRQVDAFPAKVTNCFYKAGAYTQGKDAVPRDASNYGEAIIHDLRVVHGPVQPVPGPPAPQPAPRTGLPCPHCGNPVTLAKAT